MDNEMKDMVKAMPKVGDRILSPTCKQMIARYLLNAGFGKLHTFAEKACKGIACHSDYHGDDIVSHIYAVAENPKAANTDVAPLDVYAIKREAVKDFSLWLIDVMNDYYNDNLTEEEIIQKCVSSYCTEKLFGLEG